MMMSNRDNFSSLSESLSNALSVVHRSGDLGVIVKSLASQLIEMGIPVCRLQLPISSFFGFKHPFYAGIILTWTEADGVHVNLRERQNFGLADANNALKMSPYGKLIFNGQTFTRYTPTKDHPIALIAELYEKGFTDYCALSIPLPDGAKQVMSLATRAANGFRRDLEAFLTPLKPIIAMCIYGAYQSNAAKQIAITYLGEHTGQRVLEGEFYRGNSERISTLILFADIRNFTALSERVGAERITEYVNRAFELLSSSIRYLGGEILKFIGDAALVIFPDRTIGSDQDGRREEPQRLELKNILTQLTLAIKEIREIDVDGEKLIDLGIGLHIGEVFYGNVGAKDRLDFTVMGPAVNLTSRLESLTKSLSASVLFSEQVYRALTESELEELSVNAFPPQQVKGVSSEVRVWGMSL